MGIQSDVKEITSSFLQSYRKTPTKVKIIDAFLMYQLATMLIQFIYLALFGSFPFNSFLAGFLSCASMFSITVVLRLQSNPDNADHFKMITPERSFADYCLIGLLLHFAVLTYIG